jgi:hypothetical protein
MDQSSPRPFRSNKAVHLVEALLLLVAAVFFAFHAFHLRADFPNHSPWMDWAKYTDEGWYGDGAIRHFQRGQWYVAGDFNPAVALPVWPLLEAALFRFTGVNLTAARALTVAIFFFILLTSYLLLRRSRELYAPSGVPGRAQSTALFEARPAASLAPAVAVLLLAVSPFCYAFTRMAILEPMLILLTLLALLAASYASLEQGTAKTPLRALLLHALPFISLGLLVPLMVLTKTTAVFLLPCIGWLLWARAGYRLRPFLRLVSPIAALAAVIWLSYFGFVVHPNFLSDYQYLFSVNGNTGITPSKVLSVLADTLTYGICIGAIIYPLALTTATVALVVWPRLLRNPLIPSLILWVAGYAAFLAYHDNLQPRYYLVIAIPLTLLVPIVYGTLWASTPSSTARSSARWPRLVTGVAVAVLAVLAVTDGLQTLHYVRTPEYTYVRAANEIQRIVSSERNHNPLILSISGSNLSLMTGLPSICDDFGTMDLAVRVRTYHPGWYIAWNQVDDDKMEALSPLYRLRRVAAFPAMDDPDRNLLILYRLDPAAPGKLPRPHRRPVPHLLRTNLDEQRVASPTLH